MTEAQIISRILETKSLEILTANNIQNDYFYEFFDEIGHILAHYKKYGNVLDTESFIAKFNDFDLVEVQESDRYLVDTLNEEYNYRKSAEIINKAADIMVENSFDAIDYLNKNLKTLNKATSSFGVDIIAEAEKRKDAWEHLKNNLNDRLLKTGFDELDRAIGGLSKGEELAVIFARTGQGKSWVMIKILESLWRQGLVVGLVEPEMSAIKTGYRFDTLHGNVSNSALVKGKECDEYEEYIKKLSNKATPFYVTHPRDFNRKITVSKLRSFIIANSLEVLAIDGLSYLSDERSLNGENRTTQLTHISEDLMDLSIELGIPIIAVHQSNRTGAGVEELELENIRDSDGIAYNASLILSVMQKKPGVVLAIKKNRNGSNNLKFSYIWGIDVGTFEFVPEETEDDDEVNEESTRARRRYKDKGEAFE